ncbi:MAG: IclR family transcriptional regulator [Alphaproteobacteria bacterium]|nr:IclR family transcriptional regulator [Alphaproteobacteria bacterium]MDB5720302.1 IclR family transcriptional regulator [Alphaproteobacteria bacterium]
MDDEDRPAEVDSRYRAPALEKGLDILELLATQSKPMTLTNIVNSLGRSHGELFRMVQVLEFRGYIEPDPVNDGYRLTDRLFSLGMQQPRTRNLIELALPVMRQLTLEVGQSCHLALHSRGEMVVVARMESSEQVGFSVRVGYRRPLVQAASGAVLYAFQPDDIRLRWEKMFDPPLSRDELDAFRAHADAVRQRHVELTPSRFVAGVTDISAPVMRGGMAAAALTVPYLKKLQPSLSPRETAVLVRKAADRISDQLVEGDSRI